jgi:peptide deformylase
MIVVPTSGKINLYGPAMVNVVSSRVEGDDYKQLPALRDYMLKIMRRYGGIGIAAPQVGVFKQFIVFEQLNGMVMDMVNPEITRMYGKEISGVEGCLSIPPSGNGCRVPRQQYVSVEYESAVLPGFAQEIVLSEQDAVVVQHEIDHLTGTFFVDRVGSSTKRKALEEFSKWKDERNKPYAPVAKHQSLHCR